MNEGDRNTKFLHCMANAKKRVNYISRVRKGNDFTSHRKEVKEKIAKFFEKKYSIDCFPRPTLEGILLCSFLPV